MNCVTALHRLRAEMGDKPDPTDRVKESPEYKTGYRVGSREAIDEALELVAEEADCECAEGLMDSEDAY